MKQPSENVEGYYESSVHNATGFNTLRGRVLLQHGTGDDNVHVQNSFVLTDLLMTGGSAAYDRNSTSSLGLLGFQDGLVGGKYANTPIPAGDHDTVQLSGSYQDGPVHLATATASSAAGAQAPVSPSKLTVQWFTDSDHGIRFHGSALFLRKQMARWLYKEKRRREKRSYDVDPDVDDIFL